MAKKMEDKVRKLWLRKLRKRPQEEVEEYLDLAEFFILGSAKWRRDEDGKWKHFKKKLLFKNEGGELVEAFPRKETYREFEDGKWLEKVLVKTVSPGDAEELWLSISMVLYDIARDKNQRLGKPLKPKKEPRKAGEKSWNEMAVASPQYKLVCDVGFRLYNAYVEEYEKKVNLGGLNRVVIYETHKDKTIPGMDYDLTTDIGDYVYKVIHGKVVKEFLLAFTHSDLDERLRKMSPQERELTTNNPRQLLEGVDRLTQKDIEDGWNLAGAYRTDLKTTLMTHAEIFEHLRREPVLTDGKRNNNYKLHVLSFLLQALGLNHREFVLLCSYFAGNRIYFPSLPSIPYEGRNRLVEYILSNKAPTQIVDEDKIKNLTEEEIDIQVALRQKVKAIVKASYQDTKDERDQSIEKTIYDFIFTGKRKERLREEEVIKIFNHEIDYRIDQEKQRNIDKFQTSDIEKQLALNFTNINKWLGAFKQIEIGEDFSESSFVKKVLKQMQSPVHIGTKKALQKEQDKQVVHTGMTIQEWINIFRKRVEDDKRKLAVLRKMQKEQKAKTEEADDRTITDSDLELLTLEIKREQILNDTDEQIKKWDKQFENGEDIVSEVYTEFYNAEKKHKKLTQRTKITVEEKQPYYDRGLLTLFDKCKKLQNFIKKLGLSTERNGENK